MHEAGIVADEQRGAPQHRRGGEQIDAADEIDARAPAASAAITGAACARSCAAASTATRAPRQRPPGAVRRRASSAKRSARHSLPRQLAAGPIASTGPPGGTSCAARSSCCGAEPQTRRRRRIEREEPRQLPHAMLARDRPCRDAALARPQQIGQAPSRADRPPGPSASPRRGDRARANAAPCGCFSTTISRSSPGTARTAARRAGPAAMVKRGAG